MMIIKRRATGYLSIPFCYFLLSACGGGGGGDAPIAPTATSFLVSTSAGSNGSIDPARTVNSGDTAKFLVFQNSGFRYASVSGCGGVDIPGSDNLYTTGPITADCTITATFEPITAFLAVSPQFSTNGANWNDYVVGDANGATDDTCIAGSSVSCLHGGERRKVVVTDKTVCTDLTAFDTLGAFTWECSSSKGTAQFFSTGLANGKHLSDLIAFTTPGFKPNKVTVSYKGTEWGVTPESIWWTNTVQPTATTNGGTTSLSGTSILYLLASNSTGRFTLDADKVGLVIQSGSTLNGPAGGQTSYVIESNNNDYLWLEGSIDATGDEVGVLLAGAAFSTLRNVKSDNANDNNNTSTSLDAGIRLETGAHHNRLESVTTKGNFIAGIVLNNSSDNVISGVKASGNEDYGVWLRNSSQRNKLSDVIAGADAKEACIVNSLPTGNAAGSSGVSLEGSSENTFTNVIVNCNTTGMSIDSQSLNNTLTNVTANSNTGNGVSIVADSAGLSPNTFDTLTANENTENGLYLEAVSGSMFTNVTANNNDTGIFLKFFFDQSNTGQTFGSNNNTFTTVTASGNTTRGIALDSSSNNKFTGVSPATNCPLIEENGSTNNSCTPTGSTPPTPPTIVEFHILAGTGSGPWNTQATMLTVTVGQTVRIINDDSVLHAFHAPFVSGPIFQPCPHQDTNSTLATGQFYDCVTSGPVDPGALPVTYDHVFGSSASFWLRVVP